MRTKTALLFVTPLLLAVLFSRLISADDAKVDQTPIQIIASPAILPIGSYCKIQLRATQQGNSKFGTNYEGDIIKAADNGMLVAVAFKDNWNRQTTPVLSKIPSLKRRLTSTGVGRESPPKSDNNVWIPAASIETITLLRNAEATTSGGAEK